jgi:hypothetical protein
MPYEDAKIIVYLENETKELRVLFNPAEYSLIDQVNYAEKNIPGLDGPITQFVSGASTQLNMTLIFDSHYTSSSKASGDVAAKMRDDSQNPSDVRVLTNSFIGLMAINGALHRPPIVEFVWGSLHFKGIIKAVVSRFTAFLEGGMPVRANLDVTFQSVTNPKESRRAAPFESPDRSKYRTIEQGTQLWHIAWQEYGDPELWRVIARENGLTDPKSIYPGQVLRLPAL